MKGDKLYLVVCIASALFVIARINGNAQPDTDYPAYDPTAGAYDNLAANLLAEDVKHTYGGDDWNDSIFVSFDFVVYNKANQEVARYHNEWNRLTNEGLLSGVLNDGRSYTVTFTDLHSGRGTMIIDSQEVAPEYLPTALQTARERLTGNLRWLLTPLRLLDSDIKLQLMSDSIIEGKEMTPMKVIYADSGSQNADILLYIHTGYKSIERWRVNFEGIYREYICRLTRRIGPFLFATRHWAEDFQTYVQLERIKIKFLTTTQKSGE